MISVIRIAYTNCTRNVVCIKKIPYERVCKLGSTETNGDVWRVLTEGLTLEAEPTSL